MAVIKSGASTDELTIDATSKAARVTEYLTNGVVAWADNHPTYSFATANIAPGATPNDIIMLLGASGKTIAVLRAFISTYQTTAGVNSWYLTKRSTGPTGGTYTEATKVPHDSTDPASSASARYYTAAPTAGTLVGHVWSGRIDSPAAATAGIGGYVGVIIDFTRLLGKPLTLNGSGQSLAWNFNGVALPSGMNVLGGMTWIEY